MNNFRMRKSLLTIALIISAAFPAYAQDRSSDGMMMDGGMMDGSMMGCGLLGIFMILLIIIFLIAAIAALIKYLRSK